MTSASRQAVARAWWRRFGDNRTGKAIFMGIDSFIVTSLHLAKKFRSGICLRPAAALEK